jgi:hypothetical protein
MNDRVREPVHAQAAPAEPGPARPLGFSVIIDGRLDGIRARQVATFVDRLGLAGVWLRRPWWPTDGPAMTAADTESLLAWLAAGRVRAGLVTNTETADGTWLASLPADVGPAVFVPCSPGRDLAAEVSVAAATAAGRPVLAEVTVSVGRTVAEAQARADADQLFSLAGHPAEQGLFGTLEECQAAAAELAHAGVTELVCYLPLASDLPDVLAQLRSIAIGASVLRPDEPRSAAPAPPAGWGGRQVSV